MEGAFWAAEKSFSQTFSNLALSSQICLRFERFRCAKTFSSLNYLLLNFLASQILEHQHTNFFIKIDFQIKKAALSFAEIEPSGSRWTRGFFGFQFPKEHTTEMFRIFIGISSGSICSNLPNSRVL